MSFLLALEDGRSSERSCLSLECNATSADAAHAAWPVDSLLLEISNAQFTRVKYKCIFLTSICVEYAIGYIMYFLRDYHRYMVFTCK